MSLKVIALSPPEFQEDFLPTGDRMSSVNSCNPYSLLATLTKTFSLIRANILDVLNWDTPEGIRDHVFLMRHWGEEKNILKEKLTRQAPDIICLGTFAMNFPGAIEVAKMVRELCPETLIVLGGRHIGETFWSDVSGSKMGQIHEHREANPLRLMESGVIPHVFDIVVSHDGQDLIPAIIQKVETLKSQGKTPRDVVSELEQLKHVPGYWTMGKLVNGVVHFEQPSEYKPGDISQNKSPYVYYGSDGVRFPIFSTTDWTAHVHSDSQGVSGNTCTQNCSFCSEASGKVPLRKSHEVNAADRLLSRFQDIMEVAQRDQKIPSIFVEDSILCGGHWGAMEHFCELLESAKNEGQILPPEWGCQFTVPMILHPRGQNIITRLQQCGLNYIYFGLESAKPEIAKLIGKTGGRDGWSGQSEKAVAYLSEQGIRVGTSNIFAMGESQKERMGQLGLIKSWQQKYHGNPLVYSLNLQTVHPGEWNNSYQGEKSHYATWGLDSDDPRNPLIQRLFGEAAVKYLRHPHELPSLEDLEEIEDFLETMNNTTLNWINFSHALGLQKRQISQEVQAIMQKHPSEISLLARETAHMLLQTQGEGKIIFTPGITLGLAQVLHGIFDGNFIDIVFGDHELKHVCRAIGTERISSDDTTWSSFGPVIQTSQYPGRILRKNQVIAPSYLALKYEDGSDEFIWQESIREKVQYGEILTYANVFYLSRISRLTGETLLTPELYQQLKRQYPGCIVICDGAQSLGAIIEDVSIYCDVYLGVSSKFVGASPHMGIAWVSPELVENHPRIHQIMDIPHTDFRREWAEFIHFGDKAIHQDFQKISKLQRRVRGLFESVGLIYNSGDHLMTFRIAPLHYFPSRQFYHFCLDLLPFLRSRGIDIGTNLSEFSIGHDPKKQTEYLRVTINHETTDQDVDALENALGEFLSSRK